MLENILMVSSFVFTESFWSGKGFITILIITNIWLLPSVDSDVKLHMPLSGVEYLEDFAFISRRRLGLCSSLDPPFAKFYVDGLINSIVW